MNFKLQILMAAVLGAARVTEIQSVNYCVPSLDNALKVAAAGTAGYALSKLAYNQYQQYKENKIINDSVEAITVACTPHTKLLLLSDRQREDILRKKARLICMRQRVMRQLEHEVRIFLGGPSKTLPLIHSQEHFDNLNNKLKAARTLFAMLDVVRLENKFEAEYAEPSLMDSWIENSLFHSIILNTKPDAECSPLELQQKQDSLRRRKAIFEKLQVKVSKFVLRKVVMPLLGLSALAGGDIS